MNKPIPKTKTFLDWDEVVDYIEDLYDKDIDDWYDKYKNGVINRDVECASFTQWLCDKYGDLSCFFSLHEDVLDNATYKQLEAEPAFVKEIHEIIFEHFGEYAVHGWLDFCVQ